MADSKTVAFVGGLIGFGLGLFTGLTLAPARKELTPSPYPEKECGFGHWFAMLDNNVLRYFVDEPFAKFTINWLGGKVYKGEEVAVTFPAYADLRFVAVTRDTRFPGQEGFLYQLSWYQSLAGERSIGDFFESMTRAGLIKYGGTFTGWPTSGGAGG